MPDEKQLPIPFPLYGLDVSVPFSKQPDQTTPQALNVRTFEPGTQRGRGGSRSGLSKLIPARVGTTGKIQCLDTVVSTDVSALLDTLPAIGGGTTDPSDGVRNPGRTVRTGGSGWQPTRHGGNLPGIQFVQKATSIRSFPVAATCTFANPVSRNNLIVVVMSTGGYTSTSLTDNLGNTYVNDISYFSFLISHSIVAFDGACTITFPDTQSDSALMCCLEYKNTSTLGVTDGTATNFSTDISGTLTTTNVGIHNSGSLLIGAFGVATAPSDSGGSYVPSAGFTARCNLNEQKPGTGTFIYLFVEDQIGLNSDTAATCTTQGFATPALDDYDAMGISFKKK